MDSRIEIFETIRKSRDKADKAYNEHQALIQESITKCGFLNYQEFESAFINYEQHRKQ
jgi:hypothetical protein